MMSIVSLNSIKLAKHATALFKNDINLAHKQVSLWFDNEDAGSKASESVASESGNFTALDYQVFSANENFMWNNGLDAYWTATKQLFTSKILNLKIDRNTSDFGDLSF